MYCLWKARTESGRPINKGRQTTENAMRCRQYSCSLCSSKCFIIWIGNISLLVIWVAFANRLQGSVVNREPGLLCWLFIRSITGFGALMFYYSAKIVNLAFRLNFVAVVSKRWVGFTLLSRCPLVYSRPGPILNCNKASLQGLVK